MKRKPWSSDEVAMLLELYQHVSTADIAARLGRGLRSTYQKANGLGLKKCDAYLSSDASGRIKRGSHPASALKRFRPGLVPWNKGVKFDAGGRSVETRFKAGQMMGAAKRNYVPIGSYRLTKDGYLEQKTTDDQAVSPARRWKPVTRIVWESQCGPIPAGHIVVFKLGMFSNKLDEITIDRLECISRAEAVQRNHPRAKSPELGKIYQLKGAITKQVNRINREANERKIA